ncbi:DUF1598 domain-containing protein [Schlesneria paludicola]|uniref:DUF1598 domain-containing protein n=1 Tax=Schlesneria paludicola TaxID=360056 RepID=UPI00029A3A0C|nr:DUF1598 domain-containing protein [Schlesneria paludicola]
MVHQGRVCFGFRRIVGQLLTHSSCVAVLACSGLAADSLSDRDQRVADHLAAGEFGPALAIATETANTDEQASLLKQIATAQQEAGDHDAAQGTSRRMPRAAATKSNLLAARPDTARLAGGQANFGMLINLIQRNTSGKWDDVEGESAITPFQTGVRVSPAGLLHRVTEQENSGQLQAMGVRARQADLNSDVSHKSELRMVSLTRLEREVARRMEEGLPIPETMSQLAGLSQVKFVFVYPETNEIVVAGPANGWEYNPQGQPISLNDGRPTLQLDDLVTVLRTFASGKADFGCSINTRDEGVKALQEFAKSSTKSGGLDPSATRKWVNDLQSALGRQDVVVWGVPQDSRVARVIVEADYRMKLIGIDKLDAGKEIPSYFDLLPVAQQKSQNLDALRWWLALKFDGVTHSNDKTAFEMHGSSVLCQSENQLLTADGKHVPTGQSEATNRLFAENFTANYDKLAKRDTVFADTQNIFDLALCAALIKHEGLADKASWNMGVFAPHGAYTPASYAVPKEVDSVVNHRVYSRRNIVVQVAGGVRADVMAAAKDVSLNTTEPRLDDVGRDAKAAKLPVGRWWWDSTK